MSNPVVTAEQHAAYERRLDIARRAIANPARLTWRCPECENYIPKADSTSACPVCGATI